MIPHPRTVLAFLDPFFGVPRATPEAIAAFPPPPIGGPDEGPPPSRPCDCYPWEACEGCGPKAKRGGA